MARGKYSYSMQAQSVSTAITILEITAPSTAALIIHRAWVGGNSTTAGAVEVQLLRKSAACTGTASPPTPSPVDAASASGTSVRWKATAEGTAGAILYSQIMRIDGGGFDYLPVPEERFIVPPSGIIALKFATAPAATNFSAGIIYEELG